jgi:putative ABC transport system permease protein
MKFLDVLKRSGRNLKQAKVRTLLTASAIAVGGFTLTLTLAAATGAREYANRLVQANADPNAVIVAKDESLFGTGSTKPQEYSDDLANLYGSPMKQLNNDDISKLKKLPHVKSVQKQYNLSAQFITRESAKKYTGSLAVYSSSQKPEMKAGTALAQLMDGSILLADDYVPLLHFKDAQDAIGKTITVQLQKVSGQTQSASYTIEGITTKSSLALNFSPTGVYLSEADAQAAHDFINGGTVSAGQVSSVTVISDGTIKPDELKQTITHMGYAARTAADLQQLLNQVISVLQGIIVVFGLITLIASFFGVVNTQYISVLERTREIGLMKALGTSRRTVSRIFMIEATWIGFLGALLGALLAIAAGTALNPVISDALHFGSEHLLVFSPLQIAALIAFLMFITTVAGLLPARKAAKLDPIEALRTE